MIVRYAKEVAEGAAEHTKASVMIRFFLLILTVTLSFTVQAEELCGNSELKIEPDMQRPEKAFTSEAFDDALATLAEIGRKPDSGESWLIVGNSIQLVRGWLLKKAALEAIETISTSDDEQAIDNFCDFFVNHAYYYD